MNLEKVLLHIKLFNKMVLLFFKSKNIQAIDSNSRAITILIELKKTNFPIYTTLP